MLVEFTLDGEPVQAGSKTRLSDLLLGRNTSTRRGVMGTSWPVLGLRPTRSPFLRMPKEPKEESFTDRPDARLAEISCRMSSTSSWDSLRGSPTFWTTASARSARVSVLPPILIYPSPTPYRGRC